MTDIKYSDILENSTLLRKMRCISRISFVLKIPLLPCIRQKASFPTRNVSPHLTGIKFYREEFQKYT